MNNSNFTNRRNHSQPYISWKGSSQMRAAALPSNSRPLNNSTVGNLYNINPRFIESRKIRVVHPELQNKHNLRPLPRPLKHWRRQLNPNNMSGTQKVKVSDVMDKPGSYIVSQNKVCSDCLTASNIESYINKDISCSNNCKTRIRNVTYISNNIFTSSKEYLQNRIKTYEQNNKIQKIPNNNYFNPPNDSKSGSQTFYSLYKPSYLNLENQQNNTQSYFLDCSMVTVIYKPTNPEFIKNGAVSSNEYINNKSNITTKNYYYATQLTSDNKNYSTWNIDTIKNTWGSDNLKIPNYTKTICTYRLGNHTKCFYTDPSKIVKNYEKSRKSTRINLQSQNFKITDNNKSCLYKNNIRRGNTCF